MAISPVSALVNAEASLVSAVAATTAHVKQVATSALPSALAELHNAVEQAKGRIQSAAMLYRATLADLEFDIASLTAGILEDLESVSQPQPLSAPATDKEGEGEVIVTAITDPDVAEKFLSCVVEESTEKDEVVQVSVAANPPSEEPVASPLAPLQDTETGETESSPASTPAKAPKGKGKPAKGKASGKAK